MGRDIQIRYNEDGGIEFQSTRPAWGATQEEAQPAQGTQISIHAPRMGRDSKIVQNI